MFKHFVERRWREWKIRRTLRDTIRHASIMATGHFKMPTVKENLLEIEGLTVVFNEGKPLAHRALHGVNVSIGEGEILGLVGESGSGKTVLSLSVLGLLPPNGKVSSGSIRFQNHNVIGLPEKELRRIRGKEIAMIFQDPQASLNPVYPVGRQVEWVLKLHRGITGPAAESEVLRLFESVKLRDPLRCAKAYPHELSGGMCQRVMIAMALACRPKLLIADEPTSALDVTIQAEIVGLLADISKEFQMAMLFITHDLGIAAHLCQKVVVLEAGIVAESGLIRDVFTSPKADYTRKLLQSLFVPRFGSDMPLMEVAPTV